MLILRSTTAELRVRTNSVATVDASVEYVDNNGTTLTTSTQATAINSSTTTAILSSPAASTARGAMSVGIWNKSLTVSVLATVIYYNGATEFEIVEYPLSPGSGLCYEKDRGWYLSSSPSLETVTTYATPGTFTYTKPPGVRSIEIHCGGGGGGSQGTFTTEVNGTANTGASGGGYARAFIVSPTATYTIVVGAGGVAGTVANSHTPTSGGTSSATDAGSVVVCRATGGDPGVSAYISIQGLPQVTGLGSAGGVGNVGDVLGRGAPGQPGYLLSATQPMGGKGGRGVLNAGVGANGVSAGQISGVVDGNPGEPGSVIIVEHW